MKATADLVIRRLEADLGPEAIVTDRATLETHAVDGVIPLVVCRPADADQVAAAVRICAEVGAAVAPWGGGTAVALGNIPRRIDAVLALSRLDRLIEHDDSNLTATVQAGMTASALQPHLSRRDQFLALDPPHPDRATIGGIVAANTNGPRRMLYGGVRDLVIGMKMVLSAGEQVKAGGKVVKNVAGYDMCKLFVGSLGTLGIITEVTFKMAPMPERAATVVAGGDFAAVFRLVDALFASTLQPAAIAVLNRTAVEGVGLDGAPVSVAVAVEGFSESVDRHVRDITAMAHAAGITADVRQDSSHETLWAGVRDFPSAGDDGAVFRLTVPLGDVAAAVEAAWRAPAAGGGLRIIAHAGMGTIWIRGAAAQARAMFAALVAIAGAHRGHAVLAAAPPPVKRDLDVWGPPPAALVLMREIKQRFDPQHLLNPGRFVASL